jgi:cell division protein FtsA
MPVRVAAPIGVGGLTDHLLTPAFSTSIGLLRWGARQVLQGDPALYEAPGGREPFSRVRGWVRNLFP